MIKSFDYLKNGYEKIGVVCITVVFQTYAGEADRQQDGLHPDQI